MSFLALSQKPLFVAGVGLFGGVSSGILCWRIWWLTPESAGEASGSAKAEEPTPKYLYDPKTFRIPFETRSISPEGFGITGGDCFKNLFPNILQTQRPHDLPERPDHMSGIDFSGDAVGCKLIKWSGTIGGNAVIYRSESSIKTNSAGLVMSAAVSNLKAKGSLSFEFHMLLLEKDDSGWHPHSQGGWNFALKSPHFPPFTAKTPDNTESWTSAVQDLLAITDEEIKSIQSGGAQWTDTAYAGIFTTAPGGSELLEDGSVERSWIIKYLPSQTTIYTSFFAEKRGNWTGADGYCGPFRLADPEKLDEKTRDLCYRDSKTVRV